MRGSFVVFALRRCLSWLPATGVQIPPQGNHHVCLSVRYPSTTASPAFSPLNTPQLRLLDSIDESLRHAVESVQLSAMAALKAVLQNWFPVGQDGPSERLRTRWVNTARCLPELCTVDCLRRKAPKGRVRRVCGGEILTHRVLLSRFFRSTRGFFRSGVRLCRCVSPCFVCFDCFGRVALDVYVSTVCTTRAFLCCIARSGLFHRGMSLFSVVLLSPCGFRTVGLYVTGLRTEENAAVARGYAMALGVLPRKLAGEYKGCAYGPSPIACFPFSFVSCALATCSSSSALVPNR